MKKKLIIVILATISLSLISAMPPHPRVIQEYEENDSLPLLSRQMAIDAQIGKNQAVKSFPNSGTRKVLVLVVGFTRGCSIGRNYPVRGVPSSVTITYLFLRT